MIRFHLKCDQDHGFESWFQSNEAFEKLVKNGMVTCTVCGSAQVMKSVMAPAVSTSPHVAPPQQLDATLAKIRDAVEKNASYVGGSFVKQARDMHDGVIPERPIYGEARLGEAKKLVDEGIPVVPLPFIPRKKTN
ncbi:DUF1178 family protein [Yoonia sp.]|uniref:DUF1178 family protein n=1 Tax=Yoonia sp. TaxID=2212373 RepID=UPI0019D93DB6|nr:DUF1178 family protein [Yoonia sp.]MBE0412918.1 DUF1178 family protein [Yoonia sp.]